MGLLCFRGDQHFDKFYIIREHKMGKIFLKWNIVKQKSHLDRVTTGVF